ncbi:MAG: DUF417 family protein [Nocardioidaceae bacterium]
MNLLWIGTLSSRTTRWRTSAPRLLEPAVPLLKTLGEKQTARIVGMTEIALASLIAAKPLAPRASVLGGLGAVGMFATTLTFLFTTPGVWQEGNGSPKLSTVGQFLVKDSVFLGASLLATAESLRAARRR